MNWQDRITVNPAVCHGKACIQGTRVTVSVILANLAAGESIDDIVRGYHIERQDIEAALQYAATNSEVAVSKSTARKHNLAEIVRRVPKGYKTEEVDWGKAEGKEEW